MNTIGNLGKTKIWIAVGSIIVLGILILIINKPKEDKKVEEVPAIIDNTKTEVKKTTTSTSTTRGAASLSYAQALTKYANTRIQINASCQMTPLKVVYKVGTSVMLDNRSDSSKSVLFNGTRYSIAGYGFKIVTLNTAKTFQVDCGSSQNVATITVAK